MTAEAYLGAIASAAAPEGSDSIVAPPAAERATLGDRPRSCSLSRDEAVRVLARSVKLRAAAHPALIDGLASSKACLRHGCALALVLGAPTTPRRR